MKAAKGFSAERAPKILHLYERLNPFMKPDFAFLDSLHVPVLREVEIDGVHHIHLTSIGFLSEQNTELRKLTKAGPAIAKAMKRIVELTLQFLGNA